MFNTIRRWIYRINNYQNILNQLENTDKDKWKYISQVASLREKEKELRNEMERLVSLLSGNTWNKGDNMMEAIEAFQQTKYLKEHKEDIILIFKGNMDDPEEAARQILEYFEIEVKEEMERGKVKFIYE